MAFRPLSALLASLLAVPSTPSAPASNVLLIVIDDVGVDRVRTYGTHPSPAPTPTLDALAADGVLFETCWVMPYCSPTRAAILTGRHPFRTGIGAVVTNKVGESGLGLDEWILPEVLEQGSAGAIRTAAIGKWHLGGPADDFWHAEASGFELYSGAPENLGFPGDEDVWWDFHKLVHGSSVHVTRYATTDEVDDAIRAVDRFGGDPWFLYLALHAAHLPYHAPPDHLHDRSLHGDPAETPAAHHAAMVQATDAEIGRLLASLSPATLASTTVIVVADNGTQGPATTPPSVPTHGKGTLFEGGIRVPLIIAGAGVAPAARGRRCDALVQATDLFATAASLMGIEAHEVVPPSVALDSRSLLPYLADPGRASTRDVLFTEHFKPNHADPPDYTVHRVAVRGTEFKLVRDALTGTERLYDLAADPYELRDILAAGGELTAEQRRARLDLARWLDELAR